MRDRPPTCASWPERLTKTPCAVTLSMSLGDFVEAFEKNRPALPARPPVSREPGGVTPNTLKSWLRRKDHEAYLLFQRGFAEAVTYATLTALRAIMEGVASHPKRAFAFLARRDPDRWRKAVS